MIQPLAQQLQVSAMKSLKKTLTENIQWALTREYNNALTVVIFLKSHIEIMRGREDEHISCRLKIFKVCWKLLGCCWLLFIKDISSNYIYSRSTGRSGAVKGRMSFILSAWEDILSATAWTWQESAVRFRERSKFKSSPSGLKSLFSWQVHV